MSHTAYALACILALGVPSAAAGATYTLEFAGEIDFVDDVDGVFGDFFEVGDPFDGMFLYDTDTPDHQPEDPTVGDYPHPVPFDPHGLFVFVNGATFGPNPSVSFVFQVYDDLSDGLQAGAPMVSGAPADGARLWFENGPGTAFDSDAPPTSIDLADFESPNFALATFGSGLSQAWGQIESLTLVPEPSGPLMLGTGLAALAGMHGRRRRGYGPLNVKPPRTNGP